MYGVCVGAEDERQLPLLDCWGSGRVTLLWDCKQSCTQVRPHWSSTAQKCSFATEMGFLVTQLSPPKCPHGTVPFPEQRTYWIINTFIYPSIIIDIYTVQAGGSCLCAILKINICLELCTTSHTALLSEDIPTFSVLVFLCEWYFFLNVPRTRRVNLTCYCVNGAFTKHTLCGVGLLNLWMTQFCECMSLKLESCSQKTLERN